MRRATRWAPRLAPLSSWALFLLPSSVEAQMENLQVLPAEMSRSEVNAVMRTFTSALGVRCSDCHVGEEGAPLSSYDFASDEPVMKRKTREMMRMVERINREVLAILPDRAEGEPMVTCATCHGGLRVPRAIDEVVTGVIAAEGVDAAAARYEELREHFFGGRQYDFSESHLLQIASDLSREGQLDAAERFYGEALTYFPESTGGLLGLAQLAEVREDLDAAREYYRRVLAIDPAHAGARRRLEAIGG